MAPALERIRRIRALVEEASRSTLEQQVERAVSAEAAQQRAAAAALSVRAAGMAALLTSGGPSGRKAAARASSGKVETGEQRDARYLAETEFAAGLPGRIELQRDAAEQARRTLVCREEFLARRKERRQIEILIEEESRRRAVDDARREQRSLDDWYAFSRVRRAKRSRAAVTRSAGPGKG